MVFLFFFFFRGGEERDGLVGLGFLVLESYTVVI